MWPEGKHNAIHLKRLAEREALREKSLARSAPKSPASEKSRPGASKP